VAAGSIEHLDGPDVVDESGDVAHKGYTLAFVEFDDFGEFFHPCQLVEMQEAIRSAKEKQGKVAVLVFVHGWKNNASDRSGNVWGFRNQLREYARNTSALPPNVPLIGIYIGWRGAVVRTLKDFSYWDRRDTATHIAGAHMSETLMSIIHETKGQNGDQSTLIMVGHSFGGLLLEHAITQSLVSMMLAQFDPKVTEPVDFQPRQWNLWVTGGVQ
jgi:hypothetical protein